jgi:outer membrane receptor protein involved in Fe transport
MRKHAVRRSRSIPARLPLAVAVCIACQMPAYAQDAPPPAEPPQTTARTLDTVMVTAQKRTENLQEVPLSIQAINEQTLEEHNVHSFEDYAKLIPSLTFQTIGGGVFNGPGFVQVYMRGVNSGGDGNHSGSQPSVGMYLDEQPITTIQGALDIHMYDIARVEALAGPQGTLYGASSEAGTVRIITNKPDPSGFAAGYRIEGNSVSGGGTGHVVDGMLNIPISERAAVRLVGWDKHVAGYVDNVLGSRTFPTSGITIDNADRTEEDYNEADIQGARAALRIDLDDGWTITPQVMGQKMDATGSSGFDPEVGDLELTHFYPESSEDRWTQAALTVQGRIGNFDLTYAFAHLKRDVDSEADYNDYGFWYDTLAGYGAYFYDNDGELINPSQYIQAKDGYRKTSHELRIVSPAENRLRFVAGLFWQRSEHDIFQRYRVDELADVLEVPGWSDTIWLTAQERVDQDQAVFGEVSFDFTPALTLTGGMRFFRAENSLKGFFGFGEGYSGSTGVAGCFSDESVQGAPCTNLDKETEEDDHIGKVNLTWKPAENKLLYLTWSEGYRPGGINRRGTVPPYTSDFLTNYEFGWKTTWADNRLMFNGAVFREEWKDFQFSYLGANGLTEIRNAGQARINGIETELRWRATYNFELSGGAAWYDAELTQDYCGFLDLDGESVTECPPGTINPQTGEPVTGPEAEAGGRLPSVPRFKGNLTGRYTWNMAAGEAYVQGALLHVTDRTTDLRDAQRELMGNLDGYSLFDLSAGFRRGNWALDFFLDNAFDERAEVARFAQCATLVCGNQPYTVVARPRTFGVRFSQDF